MGNIVNNTINNSIPTKQVARQSRSPASQKYCDQNKVRYHFCCGRKKVQHQNYCGQEKVQYHKYCSQKKVQYLDRSTRRAPLVQKYSDTPTYILSMLCFSPKLAYFQNKRRLNEHDEQQAYRCPRYQACFSFGCCRGTACTLRTYIGFMLRLGQGVPILSRNIDCI